MYEHDQYFIVSLFGVFIGHRVFRSQTCVFPTVSSNMIELSVAESAVQDCSQSCDETMWVHPPNLLNYCLEYCQPPM